MIWKKILPLSLTFKIIKVSGSSIFLRVLLMGRSGCPTKGWNLGGLPASQKVRTSSYVWYHPHQKIESPCPLITDHTLSLIAFRQILSKMLPEACIFSNTIMNLKRLVRTKSLNTRQCPVGLSPRIIPHLPLRHV